MFSASRDVLAYVASAIPYGTRLGSVERTGDALRMSDRREVQGWPRLSPDGKWLARQRVDGVEGNPDIWVENLENGRHIRVTSSPKVDLLAVWSPDGRSLAYISDARQAPAISIAAADGTGVTRTIPCPGVACETTDWSSDGQELIVTVRTPGGSDVWAVRTDAAATPRPLLADAFNQYDARLSWDRQWIAYVSDETGKPQVSVQRRGGDRQRFPISIAGGTQPVWSQGGELFFVDPAGRLFSVSARRAANGDVTFGVPVALPVPLIAVGHWSTQYDVSPDGRRVFFMDRSSERPSPTIELVQGWRALLR
jgi:Tol biopolymer transport system component